MMKGLADLEMTALDGRGESAPPSPRFPHVLVVHDWQPVADPSWQRILTETAGTNLYDEPHLRIVNGSSRLELIGGLWVNVEREDAGLPSLRNQWDQKYPWLEDFWIVEEWFPQTVSRETWEARERETEDGITFLAHPLYPSRGEYLYFTHFRRPSGLGEDLPEIPTPSGLRFLAGLWRRSRDLKPPSRRERERRATEKRERAEAVAKSKRRDIFYNEVGGMTGLTPNVSLAGLDIPKE
jgi:hypothetical protein